MRAEIITIGDELLIGQVVDTNSAYMAQRLNEWGIALYQITSVHDDAIHIKTAIDDALRHADIVITTGGLGPTKDDITKHVLCDYFGTHLVVDEQVKQHVLTLYKDRPQVLNRLTETQWQVPAAAEILENEIGSAPLMVFKVKRCSASGDECEKLLISLPGVPREMEHAMQVKIGPYLRVWLDAHGGGTSIVHSMVYVHNIPESALAIRIEEWENQLPATMHLAYLPQPEKRLICLRLSGFGVEAKDLEAEWEKVMPLIEAYRVTVDNNDKK